MRRVSGFILLVLTCSAAAVLAGSVVSEFRGEPARNKVTLKWTSEAEINLKGFEIERGLDDKTFERIAVVEAKGSATTKTDYVYEDNTVFKSSLRVYYYRLKIVDRDGSFTYSNTISVNPTISSARATWGSIKAMFR
ncbi:MAG: hypothetical protein ONB48_00620 [candidate division KSB1 bacterium]|nr:hypothetical protein [candidate division KSB1 bacterium]MDZ7272819.1 hypothetical protein [candidate division KSB1 bacterium]MDZ7284157.1 hypothetical protein [candidate division KSB1 bacterium]MDZ7297445.1 hypothetical protein [candidate division KSB1 bacterium]MDZ7305581.1 hypothetical protein [candidate division KSB1 bacterium]